MADKVTDTVWNSSMHQLSWEKYWFGDFVDEKSYEMLIGKRGKFISTIPRKEGRK